MSITARIVTAAAVALALSGCASLTAAPTRADLQASHDVLSKRVAEIQARPAWPAAWKSVVTDKMAAFDQAYIAANDKPTKYNLQVGQWKANRTQDWLP